MEDFIGQLLLILSVLGYILRALGFVVLGYGLGRFTMDAYKKAVWQVQVALAFGFFILVVGLTRFTSPAAIGMFGLGAGAALIMAGMGKKDEKEE
jgi:hypothetical protein